MAKVVLSIDDSTIADVLCSALEGGGSGNWAQITGYVDPRLLSFRSDEDQVFPHLDYPLNPGGAVLIRDVTDERAGTGPVHRLTRRRLLRGLQLLCDPKKSPPRHLVAVISNDFDAETGDVLLQLALLGEIRYG